MNKCCSEVEGLGKLGACKNGSADGKSAGTSRIGCEKKKGSKETQFQNYHMYTLPKFPLGRLGRSQPDYQVALATAPRRCPWPRAG